MKRITTALIASALLTAPTTKDHGIPNSLSRARYQQVTPGLTDSPRAETASPAAKMLRGGNVAT